MSDPLILHTYTRADCIVFFKTRDQWGELSNMAAGFPITIQETHILTAEALYQACRFPHRPDIQQLLIEQASPMAAKMKSKPYRKDSRADWETVNLTIMRWCIRVKLAQNWQTFGRILRATGTKPIVEASPKDQYWATTSVDDTTLRGANTMGRLLTDLRDELLTADAHALRTVQPPELEQFSLLGIPIGTIQDDTLQTS